MGFVFVRYGECVEDVIVLRTKDACPQFHIIICTISIFFSLFLAVLSTLLALVFSPSCLPFVSSYSLLHYDSSISLFGFRAGPSIAVSKTNGPGFSDLVLFSFLPYLFRTLPV